MRDRRPAETSCRRQAPPTTRTGQSGRSGSEVPARGGQDAPAGVMAALRELRDAAAAHDDDLPGLRVPHGPAA
jgi:hypothetical protein